MDDGGQVVKEHFFAIDYDFDEKRYGRIPADVPPKELDAMRTIMADQYVSAESTLADLDEETLEELKALGYID